MNGSKCSKSNDFSLKIYSSTSKKYTASKLLQQVQVTLKSYLSTCNLLLPTF